MEPRCLTSTPATVCVPSLMPHHPLLGNWPRDGLPSAHNYAWYMEVAQKICYVDILGKCIEQQSCARATVPSVLRQRGAQALWTMRAQCGEGRGWWSATVSELRPRATRGLIRPGRALEMPSRSEQHGWGQVGPRTAPGLCVSDGWDQTGQD